MGEASGAKTNAALMDVSLARSNTDSFCRRWQLMLIDLLRNSCVHSLDSCGRFKR